MAKRRLETSGLADQHQSSAGTDGDNNSACTYDMPTACHALCHVLYIYRSFNCPKSPMVGASTLQAVIFICLCPAECQHLGQCLHMLDTQIFMKC